MTNYIRLSDLKYPLSERDIKKEYPNTAFPKPFKKVGYEVVFTKPKPTTDDLKMAIEGSPVLTESGTWEQHWNIVDRFQDIDGGPTKEEQEAEFLTKKENDAITSVLTTLKSEFESYIYGHYGPATQMTILKAYSDEDTPPDLKAKAKEVGDWIKMIQAYYKVVKSDVLGGNVDATWDFKQFDATKPQWDFEDFV